MDAKERFARFVDEYGPVHPTLGACYLWTGCVDKDGYGRFNTGDDPSAPAYRVSYEWEYGPLEDGYEPDHLCRVRLCIRPSHMEAVLSGINNSRAHRKYTNDQVYMVKDLLGRGWSQQRIASVTGVKQPTVSLIKQGKRLYAI